MCKSEVIRGSVLDRMEQDLVDPLLSTGHRLRAFDQTQLPHDTDDQLCGGSKKRLCLTGRVTAEGSGLLQQALINTQARYNHSQGWTNASQPEQSAYAVQTSAFVTLRDAGTSSVYHRRRVPNAKSVNNFSTSTPITFSKNTQPVSAFGLPVDNNTTNVASEPKCQEQTGHEINMTSNIIHGTKHVSFEQQVKEHSDDGNRSRRLKPPHNVETSHLPDNSVEIYKRQQEPPISINTRESKYEDLLSVIDPALLEQPTRKTPLKGQSLSSKAAINHNVSQKLVLQQSGFGAQALPEPSQLRIQQRVFNQPHSQATLPCLVARPFTTVPDLQLTTREFYREIESIRRRCDLEMLKVRQLIFMYYRARGQSYEQYESFRRAYYKSRLELIFDRVYSSNGPFDLLRENVGYLGDHVNECAAILFIGLKRLFVPIGTLWADGIDLGHTEMQRRTFCCEVQAFKLCLESCQLLTIVWTDKTAGVRQWLTTEKARRTIYEQSRNESYDEDNVASKEMYGH